MLDGSADLGYNGFMQKVLNREWLSSIPKAEIHLHLEGAIPMACLWELIQKYGGDSDIRSQGALQRRFIYSDFTHFIQTWVWKNKFIREYEDFDFIAMSVAEDLKSQNIRYVEAFISPPDFVRHGLETGRIIESVRRGLDRVAGIEINLVVDLVRDYGESRALATLDATIEAKGYGVLGVGIGGSEKEFPPSLYKSVYAKARANDLKTSAHAGEAAGAESIWGAIRDLQVDRIGHGTRAVEDPGLIEYLVRHQIPIEMCPLSNLRTQVISSIAEHPIRDFFNRGVLVTVNTDDPKMFNNSLVDEFECLMAEHHFTQEEVKQLTLNALRASWLGDQKRKQMIEEISSDILWRAPVV